MAGGPVSAPICQGSRTGGSMPRTDPINSGPTVPDTPPPFPMPVLWPCWSTGHGVHSASDVRVSGLSGVYVCDTQLRCDMQPYPDH